MLTDEELRELIESAAAAGPEPPGLDMSTFAVDVDPVRPRVRRRHHDEKKQ